MPNRVDESLWSDQESWQDEDATGQDQDLGAGGDTVEVAVEVLIIGKWMVWDRGVLIVTVT